MATKNESREDWLPFEKEPEKQAPARSTERVSCQYCEDAGWCDYCKRGKEQRDADLAERRRKA